MNELQRELDEVTKSMEEQEQELEQGREATKRLEEQKKELEQERDELTKKLAEQKQELTEVKEQIFRERTSGVAWGLGIAGVTIAVCLLLRWSMLRRQKG
jgi:chromosome segregation ATPase